MQENILSKKLNLGLNFSTPSGGVTSPLLKESMVVVHCTDYIVYTVQCTLSKELCLNALIVHCTVCAF